MATTLYFRGGSGDGNHYAGVHRGEQSTKYNLAAGIWQPMQLSTTRGTVASPGLVANIPSVAGPTGGVEFTEPTLGYAMEFMSPPLAAGVTISGNVTYNLWGLENSMSANLSMNVGIDRVGPDGTIISSVLKSNNAIEAGTVVAVANAAVAPTSTTFAKGDRIRARLYIDDAGGTMGTGFTGTINFAGATGAATGDSFITFTENLTFQTTDPTGTQLFLTDTAGPAVGAELEKEMWTARGSGVNTAVVATQNGYAAPKRWTDTSGGTNIEWYTRPLNAFTLGGLIKLRTRALTSNIASWTSLRAEIAVVNGDGSGAVIWSSHGIIALPSMEGSWDPLGATDTGGRLVVSAGSDHIGYHAGPDIAVTNGQRLRLRFYAEDSSGDASVSGHTCTISYDDATVDGSGDSWIRLEQSVTEFVSSTPRYINRSTVVRQLRSHIGSVIANWRTIPRVPIVPRFVQRMVVVPAAKAGPVGAVSTRWRELPRVVPPVVVDRWTNRATVIEAVGTHRPDPVITNWRTIPRVPIVDRIIDRGRTVQAAARGLPGSVTTRTARRAGALLNVAAYRWYLDDADPDSNTPSVAQNTPLPILDDDTSTVLLRLLVENVGDFENTDTLILQGRINGGTWAGITLSIAGVDLASSPNIVSTFTPTTSRLTGSAKAFDSTDSQIAESNVGWSARRVDPGEYMELGLYVKRRTSTSPGDLIEFRVVKSVAGQFLPIDITMSVTPTANVVQSRLVAWPRTVQVGPSQARRVEHIVVEHPSFRDVAAVVTDRAINRAQVIDVIRRSSPGAVIVRAIARSGDRVARSVVVATTLARHSDPAIASFRSLPRVPIVDAVRRSLIVGAVRNAQPAPATVSWRTIPRVPIVDAVRRVVVVEAARHAQPGAVIALWRTAPRIPVVVLGDRVVSRALVVPLQRSVQRTGDVTAGFRTVPRVPIVDAVRRTAILEAARHVQPGSVRWSTVARPGDRALQRALTVPAVGIRTPLAVATRWRTIPRPAVVVAGDRALQRALTVAAVGSRTPGAVIARARSLPRVPIVDAVRRTLVVGPAQRGPVGQVQWRLPPRTVVVVAGDRARSRATVVEAFAGRRSLSVVARWRTQPRIPIVPRVVQRAVIVDARHAKPRTFQARGLTPARRFVAPAFRRVPHQAFVYPRALRRTAPLRVIARRPHLINPPGPSHGSTTGIAHSSSARLKVKHSPSGLTGARGEQRTAPGGGRTAMIASTGTTTAGET